MKRIKKGRGKGWHDHSNEHALASRGIRTVHKHDMDWKDWEGHYKDWDFIGKDKFLKLDLDYMNLEVVDMWDGRLYLREKDTGDFYMWGGEVIDALYPSNHIDGEPSHSVIFVGGELKSASSDIHSKEDIYFTYRKNRESIRADFDPDDHLSYAKNFLLYNPLRPREVESYKGLKGHNLHGIDDKIWQEAYKWASKMDVIYIDDWRYNIHDKE